MCFEQEQEKHKPRYKNTELKSKNHKPKNTNTNPATDLPCQLNTKATNTNLATDFSCQPNTKTTNTNPTSVRNGYEELTIMDFFKSVFSEDPNQPQNDNAPELNPNLNLNSDLDSDSTAIWSFDGLIKTIVSKSESVIQTYRRDIENLGPG